MRVLDGEQVLLRVFIGESSRWHGRPLADALLETFRQRGLAGTTVLHGVAGFGASSVIHTSKTLRLSSDLPVVLEVVDTQVRVDEILPLLDEMISDGLVTMEKVRVLKYAAKPGGE